MTPRIRKSAQSTAQHGSAARMSGTGKVEASAGAAAATEQPPVPESRHIFRRSQRSLRGSFRRRVPPPPKPPPGLLTPEAASAVLTEVFRHLLEAVKREAMAGPAAAAGAVDGGKHAKNAHDDNGTLGIEASLKASARTVAGVLPHTISTWNHRPVGVISTPSTQSGSTDDASLQDCWRPARPQRQSCCYAPRRRRTSPRLGRSR